MGRDFRPDEDGVPGRDAVVILGYDLWKNEFASSSDAIGKTIFLNGIAPSARATSAALLECWEHTDDARRVAGELQARRDKD